MFRRRALLAAALLPLPALAQGRTIRLIAGSAPGGSIDAVARVVAGPLGERLGATVIVENRGGAGGTIAFDPVMRAAPDGTTLVLSHMGALVISPLVQPELNLHPFRDMAAVSLVCDVLTVLVVAAQKPWRSLGELVADARARPGALAWGSVGIGSSQWLAATQLDRTAGLVTTAVPYRGGAPAALDLLAGRLDFSFVTSASVWPHVQAGRLRALAVPARARSRFLPEVPTVEEAAGLPGFEVRNWYGLLAPRGVPAPVLARIGDALRATLAESETVAALERQGLDPTPSSAEEFTAQILAERAKWAPIVRAAGVTAE